MTVSSNLETESFNKEKFKQVLHYIISRTEPFQNIGAEVIYKLLYFNDFNYYELTELKMTGEAYGKLNHGPVPKHFHSVIAEMKSDELIEEIATTYDLHKQIKYQSLTNPQLTQLSANEIKHIDETLNKYSFMNEYQIEAISYKDMPMIATDDNENIDYDLVFYRSEEMSVREYDEQIPKPSLL